MYVTTFRLIEFGQEQRKRVITAESREAWERKFRLMDFLFSHALNHALDRYAYVAIDTQVARN